MSIDNESLTVDSSETVASNIEKITFNGTSGMGVVEYNDRLRLLNRFVDPSAYETLINRWIGVAEQLDMPLRLSQAKAVKNEYIDALYHSKRQAAYSLLGQNWDARDEAVANLQAHIAAHMHHSSTGVSWLNTLVWTLGAPVNAVVWGHNGFTPILPGPKTLTGPDLSIIPLGAANAIPITIIQVRSLINGIAARRRVLHFIRVDKQATINGLATIAGVIAFSATGGW